MAQPHQHHEHTQAHAHRHGLGGHGHSHGGVDASVRALAWSLVLTVIILVTEGVGGWMANSLALLADAGHVLTDAAALALSPFVVWLTRQPPGGAKTFGYLRWAIVAAAMH